MPKVSVIVPIFNEQKYINKLIDSFLRQTFQDFELFLIDDCSTDNTPELIKQYSDQRIKYIRNDINLQVTKSINKGIQLATGEYLFFTGADCVATINWIETGVMLLDTNPDAVGVFGNIMYSTSHVTISDRITETKHDIYGANMAFKAIYVKQLDGLNPEFKAQEDRDLAYRIQKFGKILHSFDMIIIHQQKYQTRRSIFADAKRTENMVKFIKEHNDFSNSNLWGRVLLPHRLLIVLFPPAIILAYSFRRLSDIKCAFWVFIGCCYQRLVIWQTALRERIFIV